MAAKQIVFYRGRRIALYEKSYIIAGRPIKFVGHEPDIDDIKDEIDMLLRSEPPCPMPVTPAPRSRLQRLKDWFELQIGFGGDLHRQVYYAFRDYPDAMKTTIVLFFIIGFNAAIATLIVFERIIRG